MVKLESVEQTTELPVKFLVRVAHPEQFLGLTIQQVQQGQQVLPDLQEIREQPEQSDLQDRRAAKDQSVIPDLQDRREVQVLQDHPEVMVAMAAQDRQVRQVLPEAKVLKESKGIPDLQEIQDLQVLKDRTATSAVLLSIIHLARQHQRPTRVQEKCA